MQYKSYKNITKSTKVFKPELFGWLKGKNHGPAQFVWMFTYSTNQVWMVSYT